MLNSVAFVFPGQGTQYKEMGKEFYERYSIARETFEEAGDILRVNIKDICFYNKNNDLTRTKTTQPAILTVSVAMYRVYMDVINIMPNVLAGHSLGEYSALVASGAMKFSDALRLVKKRGELMEDVVVNCDGAMAAILGVDGDILKDDCTKHRHENEILSISNYNSKSQFVISGTKKAVDRLVEKYNSKKNIATSYLAVNAPFHCSIMNNVSVMMDEELKKYKFSKFNKPVLSNVTGRPYPTPNDITDLLSKQIIAPVNWVEINSYFARLGINILVEFGPKDVLKRLSRENNPNIYAFSYDNKEDMECIKSVLLESDIGINTKEPSLVTRCMAIAVASKNQNWNNDEYQLGVIEPYKEVQRIQRKIEVECRNPTIEEMRISIDMLLSVLITKKVPKDERESRFDQLFNETGTKHIFPNFNC